MSVDRMEILKGLSREIKARKPISLISYKLEPSVYAENDIGRMLDANITDILRRRDEGLPQTFSGVSSDFVLDEVDDTA